MSPTKPIYQYEQIARQIEERILKGGLAAGERLPSERQLGYEFGVQRNTCRQALELLEREGYVATSGRRGSYVLSPAPIAADRSFLVNIRPRSGPNGTALYDGISRGAEIAGFTVSRTDTEPLPNSSMNRVPDPDGLPLGTAGIILWPHQPSDPHALKVLNQKLPLVLVDHRVSGAAIDCVRFDDVTGGFLVTDHLLRLGHTKIGFLTDEVFADSVQDRWCGYVLAHERAGVYCDSRFALLYQFIDNQILTMTLRHLRSDPATRLTAVVCSNDLVAFTLLRLLSVEGLRVPKDIAVTGYGNATPEYASAISLTTLNQPFHQMGLEASRILAERIRQNSSDRHTAPLDICMPVDLVVRGST